MATLGRDPFARLTVRRSSVPAPAGGCNWCGGRNADGKLYAYRIEHDDGRTDHVRGLFCSADCARQYHD